MHNSDTQQINDIISLKCSSYTPIAFASGTIAAGFPSPAQDHVEAALDLNEYLITNPISTFFVTVASDSMSGAHIHAGDKIIVDRGMVPLHRSIVVALINGNAFTVKRLMIERNGTAWLKAENPEYQDIHFKSNDELTIWGVVIGCFRRFP